MVRKPGGRTILVALEYLIQLILAPGTVIKFVIIIIIIIIIRIRIILVPLEYPVQLILAPGNVNQFRWDYPLV